MEEQWKDIEGYEGYYQVSDHGRVRSLDRKNSRGWNIPGRVMATPLDSKGYPYVSLHRDGRKNHRVHRLVCRAFNGEPESESLDVCHNDGTRTNNVPSNLRWGTRSENIMDAAKVHKTHYLGNKKKCKRGHRLGSPNSRGKDRECLACGKAAATVRYHKDLRGHFQEVSDIHYKNILGENKRMLRSDFPF